MTTRLCNCPQVQYATRWRPGVRNGFMQDVAFFFPMRYQRTSHAADNGVNAIFFPIRERSRKPVQDDGCGTVTVRVLPPVRSGVRRLQRGSHVCL